MERKSRPQGFRWETILAGIPPCSVLFLAATLLLACIGETAQSQSVPPYNQNLLRYDIGQTDPQKASVITTFNTFLPPDWNTLNRFNAFQEIFGVSDFARDWVAMPGVLRSPNPQSGAMDEAYLQPKCQNSGLNRLSGAALQVSTFMKPYDVYQGSIFLPYLRQNTSLPDFLPAAARARTSVDGMPPYEGDLACPTILPSQAETPTPAFLRETYGQAAVLTKTGITLIIDNAFNPFRWDGPIGDNAIMHREQSTLALGFPLPVQAISAIKTIFKTIRMNNDNDIPEDTRLILSYDLEMSVEPAPGVPEPETMADMMDRPCSPQVMHQPRNLFEASICRAMLDESASPSQRFMREVLKTRLLTPSIQLSIGVVLDSTRDFPWRDQEFMLSSYNYKNAHPEGFAPTDNSLINANSPIGNSNGRNAAWFRTRISTFHNLSLYDRGWPIVSADADDWVMAKPTGSRHLTGSIDLTAYIHDFAERSLIPGMSGQWGGCSALLPLDIPVAEVDKSCAAANRSDGNAVKGAEPLSVYRVFIVPEVHGPFYVRIVVNALRLHFANKGL